ncbi:MAG: RNA-binding protein [Deltaproteobacteria bacterium]|nr:RNA-binding protein [Deltaproteobacteria bacterium]
MSTKVFVGNLDFKTTQAELSALFSAAGQVVDVFLPSDRATGKPRGFAFVQFATEAQAKDAIARFDQQELGGRRLNVNAAEDRGARPGGGGGGGGGGRPSFGRPAPGGYGAPPPSARPAKSKGSRRGLRGKVRSLN